MFNKREIYKSGLPNRAISVYMYLCDRADKNGMSFPAVSRIASDLNLSINTVKRAIKDLEKGGYITKNPRFRENGGKSSNEYIVN